MPEGYEHGPVSVRAFAEVFTRAGAQLGEVADTVGRTAAKAVDFGGSWLPHGVEFEKNVTLLADDVGRLARHLRDVSGLLGRATGLVVLPNAVAEFEGAIAEVSAAGDCWDVVGRALREQVEQTIPAYDRVLSLNLNPPGPDKRLEVGGLRWGLIELDAARLNGLAAAADNVFAMVRSVRAGLARGESYEVFRAVEKIEKCLDGYSTAVRTTASGLSTAMVSIRTLYASYRDKSVDILTFRGLLDPDQFRKTDSIAGKLISENDAERMRACARRGDTVACDAVADWAAEHRHNIDKKINEWYRATDGLVTAVRDMYAAALENLRILAEARVFAALVPPAPAAEARPSVTLDAIEVTAPDAEGHTTITIEGSAYDLDFTAASGVAPARAPADAEYVPARTDGRCVIERPALTVIVERSLFAPDALTLVVEDGDGTATHALDFATTPVTVSTLRTHPPAPQVAAADHPPVEPDQPPAEASTDTEATAAGPDDTKSAELAVAEPDEAGQPEPTDAEAEPALQPEVPDEPAPAEPAAIDDPAEEPPESAGVEPSLAEPTEPAPDEPGPADVEPPADEPESPPANDGVADTGGDGGGEPTDPGALPAGDSASEPPDEESVSGPPTVDSESAEGPVAGETSEGERIAEPAGDSTPPVETSVAGGEPTDRGDAPAESPPDEPAPTSEVDDAATPPETPAVGVSAAPEVAGVPAPPEPAAAVDSTQSGSPVADGSAPPALPVTGGTAPSEPPAASEPVPLQSLVDGAATRSERPVPSESPVTGMPEPSVDGAATRSELPVPSESPVASKPEPSAGDAAVPSVPPDSPVASGPDLLKPLAANESVPLESSVADDVATPEPSAEEAAKPAAAELASTSDSVAVAEVAAQPVTSWAEEASGSVSGVLVPDQPNGARGRRRRGRRAAPAGREKATVGERAGTGWSVHGDLFESSEPVHSMHGVLVDDERESR